MDNNVDTCLKMGYSFIVKNIKINNFMDYLNISRAIFNELDRPISYFSISYGQRERPVTKTLRWNDKNIKKFESMLYNEINGLSVINNTTKADFPTNFEMCLDFSHYSHDYSEMEITITYKADYGILSEPLEAAVAHLSMLSNYCEIVHGFGIVMENEKNPEFFIKGISNPLLSEQQEETAYSIGYNKYTKSYKLPDVFLINILAGLSLNSDILNKLASIVGKEHLIIFKEKYSIIELPMTKKEYLDENQKKI